MPKNMKTRKAKDGFNYPYTSPDLVIDPSGKSVTTKFNELEDKMKKVGSISIDDTNTTTDKTWSSSKIDSQFKDIANEIGTETLETTSKEIVGAINEINTQVKDIENLSLIKHTDGKVYIKKQDGTLIGDGIEIGGSDVDLSKIAMSMSGQTLKLLNDGIQIATVEIPTAVIDEEQINNAVNDYITNNGITFNFALKDADYNAYITTQKIVTNPPVIKGYTDYKTISKGETIEFSGTLGSSNSLVLIPITPITTNTKDKLYFDNDYYLRPYIYNNSKIISIIQTNYSLGTNSVDGTKVNAYCFDTKARFYCNNTVLSASYSTTYLKTNSYSITYFRNTTSTDYIAISYNKELTDDEFLQLAEQFGGEN